jgi:hypothetical protein
VEEGDEASRPKLNTPDLLLSDGGPGFVVCCSPTAFKLQTMLHEVYLVGAFPLVGNDALFTCFGELIFSLVPVIRFVLAA